MTTQLFHDWINSPRQQGRVFLTSSSPILLKNLILLGKYQIKLNFELGMHDILATISVSADKCPFLCYRPNKKICPISLSR